MPFADTTEATTGLFLSIALLGVIALYRTLFLKLISILGKFHVNVAKASYFHPDITHRPGYAGLTITAAGWHLYLYWIISKRRT